MNVFSVRPKPTQMLKQEPVNFICNICGLRAAQPVLCVKEECPTELLVYGGAPRFRL